MRPSISAFRSNVTFYSSEASENPGKEYDPKIKQLVDDISKLTLVEVADLTALLKVCGWLCPRNGAVSPPLDPIMLISHVPIDNLEYH